MRILGLMVLLLGLSGCVQRSGPAPIGSAYAGPAIINLRDDLGAHSSVSATVHHGERVEILETRRRLVRVRTKNGTTGWIDAAYLLTQAQMDDLLQLAERASKLPSQGKATAYDALNVHTAANRSAPSFVQLKEGDPIEVLGHRATPRSGAPRRLPKLNDPSGSAEATTSEDVPQPPDPPGPPEDWELLSRPRLQDLPGYSKGAQVAGDDWFLVRTKDGKAGWVLTRMVQMSIPDAVAQNAEGHYIMAYRELGAVEDPASGEKMPNWLWTTSARPMQPYDFDSIRVFIYQTHRHRYETAYVERNLRGYYPVEILKPAAGTSDGHSFSIVTEEGGGFQKRTYTFAKGRVHLTAKAPYHAPPPLPDVRGTQSFGAQPQADPSWSGRFQSLRKRWFGR
ncbi:MAG: hypothetical protein ABI824_13660 [Acidobacteriota bacterium]